MENKMISMKSPNLILAGVGAIERLGEEAGALGARKALMVTDKGVVESGIGERVQSLLEDRNIHVDVFDGVIPDPDIACAEACVEFAGKDNYDIIVGVGGGSPMDIAAVTSIMVTNGGGIYDYFGVGMVKKPGLPSFLIPTTSGTGAEVTPNAILTDVNEKLKKGIVSPYILPRAAIVDPELTISLPPRVTAFSGMDALTHAIEAFTSVNASALTDIYAKEAIKLIAGSLRTAVARGDNLKARYDMSIGSLYAGIALANAGVTAVHALAYPLGGEYNVPHGIANGLLLPYVMEFNVQGDIPKFAEVARLMGEMVDHLNLIEQAYLSVDAVHALYRDLPVPQNLEELEIPEDAVPDMAEAAMKITRLMDNNPRRMTTEDAEVIFQRAMNPMDMDEIY